VCNKFTENRERENHLFPEICTMNDNISLETASTILVVDDHELVLRGISEILSKTFPTADILTAPTGEVAMRYVSQKRIDGRLGIARYVGIRTDRPHPSQIS
jgi:PleD family two-component response regulator